MMSRAAKTLVVWGIYVIVLGVLLFVAPNRLLTFFRLPATNEVWIRVVGVLTLCLGYLYLRAALAGLKHYFYWTIHTRLSLLPFFGLLFLTKLAPGALILFSAVDLLGALWTWWALRTE